MSILASIAERKISQAIEDGTLDCSKFKNKPLVYEDDSFVPADLKMAYKMLKNSGYLPAEIETRKEIHNLEQLIAKTEDAHLRLKQMKKLNVLMMKLDSQRSTPSSINDQNDYFDRVIEKVSVNQK